MTAEDLQRELREAAVLPIIVPSSVDFVMSTTAVLARSGAKAIEILMRSDAALPALRACRATYPTLLIGAGTMLAPADYDRAVEAGAQFTVSPGSTPALLDHARRGPVPLVPGVQTASEVMAAKAGGFSLMKFYPAEPAGGVAVLADYQNVFPTVSFLCSGKIGSEALSAYGKLDNVAAVGGSWMYGGADGNLSDTDVGNLMARSLRAFAAARHRS